MGKKFTMSTLFYFVFDGRFQVQAPRGAYIRRGDLTEGFLRYDFGGLTFGGADTWRGLFSEFYGILFVVLGHSFRREAAGAVALVKFKIQCPQFFSKNTFSYH